MTEFNFIFEKKALENTEQDKITEESEYTENKRTESVDHKKKSDDLKSTDSCLQNCAIDQIEDTDNPLLQMDKITEDCLDVKTITSEKAKLKPYI